MSGGLGQKRRLDLDHCVGGAARISPPVKMTSTSAFACHMRSNQLAPTRSPPTVCPMRLCQQRWIQKPPKDENTFSVFIFFSYRAARGPTLGPSSFIWQFIIYTFKTIPIKAFLTFASAIFFRRELLHAASYAATLAISAVRPLRTCKTVTGPNSGQRLARESRLERVAGSLSRLMTSFPTVVLGIILLSGVVLGDPQGIDANGVR